MVVGELPFEVLEERELAFRCTCSLERATTMIGALGRNEVESMLTEDKGAVMTCGFCNEIYQLDEEALEQILANI
jgi:molecular chaperone Hsp33